MFPPSPAPPPTNEPPQPFQPRPRALNMSRVPAECLAMDQVLPNNCRPPPPTRRMAQNSTFHGTLYHCLNVFTTLSLPDSEFYVAFHKSVAENGLLEPKNIGHFNEHHSNTEFLPSPSCIPPPPSPPNVWRAPSFLPHFQNLPERDIA